MSIPNDVYRFLQAVYPDYKLFAIFANAAKDPRTRVLEDLSDLKDCYLSIGRFGLLASSNLRKAVISVQALVIDDVGTKGPEADKVLLFLGTPTAIVRTSAGNHQWWYRLTTPVPAEQWDRFFAGVEQLLGVKLEGSGRQHLFRLPMGVNTKPARKRDPVELIKLNEDAALDPATIPPAAIPARATASGKSVGEKALEELLALIPNHKDIDRKQWVDIGHYAKGLCPEGCEPFVEWTLTWDGAPEDLDTFTREYVEEKWDSFGKDGLLSRGGMLRAMAERINPVGFKAWDARWVFDDGVEVPDVPPGKGRVQFKLGEKKQILSLAENAKRAISGLDIKCAYDEFHHRIYLEGKDITDPIVLLLRDRLTREYGKEFSISTMWEAIISLAHENKFNPVCEMLDAAETLWDGVKRLDRLGPDYFNTPDTAYARAAFRKTMLAAVRRARRPGCKFDQILVLESPEGWNKSSAWAVLAGEGNFSDANILGKNAREVQEELADIWIHENSELSGLSRTEVEHVKAFASRVNDRARPAYGRVLIDQPRQSIEVGTTNAESYLLSLTGNRRFWTFEVIQPINLDRLRNDRLQLWGEAAAAESTGETLVLDEVLWSEAADEQEKRRVIDPWEDELANLKGYMAVSVREGKECITRVAVHEFLRQRGQLLTIAAGKRIAEIMRKLGWKDCKLWVDGVSLRGFNRFLDMSEDGVQNVSRKKLF